MCKADKKRIAIMRPSQHIEKSIKLATAFGFDTIVASMIELIDMKDAEFENFICNVIDGNSDFVIFTSVNGIKWTLSKLTEDTRLRFIEGLKSANVISIGPITGLELMKYGIKSIIPTEYSSEGLLNYLCNKVQGKTVCIARSFYGSKSLVPSLIQCGAEVFETKVYTLHMPEGDAQKRLVEEAILGNIDIFPFTSTMMVHNFFKCFQKYNSNISPKEILKNSIVASIGTPTATTLKKYGVTVNFVPSKCTFEAMIEEMYLKYNI